MTGDFNVPGYEAVCTAGLRAARCEGLDRL